MRGQDSPCAFAPKAPGAYTGIDLSRSHGAWRPTTAGTDARPSQPPPVRSGPDVENAALSANNVCDLITSKLAFHYSRIAAGRLRRGWSAWPLPRRACAHRPREPGRPGTARPIRIAWEKLRTPSKSYVYSESQAGGGASPTLDWSSTRRPGTPSTWRWTNGFGAAGVDAGDGAHDSWPSLTAPGDPAGFPGAA